MSTRRKQSQKNRVGSGKKYRPSRKAGSLDSGSPPDATRTAARLGKRNPSARPLLRESPQVEALTVAWMLVVISGFLTEVASIVSLLWHWLAQPADMAAATGDTATATDFVGVVALITLFAAIALSPINLLMTMIVRRMRREAPPRSVVTAALVIALLPLPLWMIARIHFGN